MASKIVDEKIEGGFATKFLVECAERGCYQALWVDVEESETPGDLKRAIAKGDKAYRCSRHLRLNEQV